MYVRKHFHHELLTWGARIGGGFNRKLLFPREMQNGTNWHAYFPQLQVGL